MTIRRLVILPPDVRPAEVEEFRAYWNECDIKPGLEDFFVGGVRGAIRIIPISPPSSHEVWLRHQISWRVR